MNYNKNHYQKAFNSPLFQDKIYKRLNKDEVRNRILQGQIDRIECDSNEVFDYLKLFTQLDYINTTEFIPITLEERIKVVKQSKQMSTSSIF